MGLALKGLKDSLIDYLFYDEDPYHIETRPLPTNCSSVFDHFVGLVFKGLKESLIDEFFHDGDPCHRNQSIDLFCKSMGWFLYDRDLRHERVNIKDKSSFDEKSKENMIAIYVSFPFRENLLATNNLVFNIPPSVV